MKHAALFGLPGLLLMGIVCCRPADVDPDTTIRDSDTDTLTVAGLRTLIRTDLPGRVYVTDAGREGVFVLDRADRQTADNAGIVLVTAGGRRYRRAFTGPASAGWFGLSPADADIGPKLQTAVDATTGELILPDGQYVQRTEVRLRSNLTLRGTPGKVTITLPQTYVSLTNPVNHDAPLANILIEGISWVVTATGAGTYGVITIDGPTLTNLTIQQCSSQDDAATDSTNFITVKVQTGKTIRNVRVQDNDVRAKRMGCEIFNHDNVDVYAGQNITVSRNSFRSCRFGISLSGPLDTVLVAGNYVRDCSLYGIEIAGALRNVRVIDNRFEGRFDKFLEGSNDGNGNGELLGGMVVTGNQTVGTCVGGIQLFNAGYIRFANNTIRMTGRLEILTTSSRGGTYTGNSIESGSTHAIICDNAPDNTFRDNTLSNRSAPANVATFRAFGPRATGVVVVGNRFDKGPGGAYIDAVDGAILTQSANTDETGKPID